MLKGAVLAACRPRHRHQEFLSFLREIDKAVPAELDIHCIADNYATHNHPKVKAWLAARPRWHMHFATTPETVAWLQALWQRETAIPGLPLVETDETALALALAVRGVAGEQGVLDVQQDRITNPDRKARFEFVRRAAAADVQERERWFRALADPANRRREVWVLEGLRLLNDPLRTQASAPLVPKALDLLLDVHQTGALFFDAAWVDETLRGYSTPQVAAMVTQFVDKLPPDYPPRLRAKVLQSADLLMRAARVKEH